jgi:hypothetical protein
MLVFRGIDDGGSEDVVASGGFETRMMELAKSEHSRSRALVDGSELQAVLPPVLGGNNPGLENQGLVAGFPVVA